MEKNSQNLINGKGYVVENANKKRKERSTENKKDLSHEEKIEDSRTQDKNISFQENSQFLALQASQNRFTLKKL